MSHSLAILMALAASAALVCLARGQASEQVLGYNPCWVTKCGYYAQCVVEDGKSKCVCPSMCTDDYKPVCGTDGKTYGNECQLQVAACEARNGLSVASQDECNQDDPCSIVRCGYGANCHVEGGKGICRCDSICTAIAKPVCGSDGKTYGNECQLNNAACEAKRYISVVSEGECAISDPCATVRCGYGATCRVVNGKASCLCNFACPAIYAPVCGSDNRTYGNSCEMQIAACRDKKNITMVSNGECPQKRDPCALLRCLNCQVIDGKARCGVPCPKVCPLIYQPICGSDGKTYGNTCQLSVAACRESGKKIVQIHSGPCKTDCGACTAIYKPICGSDNKTYSNFCQLERSNCANKTKVTKASDGACPTKQPPVVCKPKLRGDAIKAM